jgi:hypothetical protein
VNTRAPSIVILERIAWIGRVVLGPWKGCIGWLRSLLPAQSRDTQHPLRGCPGCAALVPRRAKVCQYCRRVLPMLALR